MFLLLVTVALVAAANASPMIRNGPMFPVGRIVGGEDAQIETYPYQVSLQVYGKHNCGAAIIGKYHILTAGHCSYYKPAMLSVRAGSSIKGKGGSIHSVETIIRHDEYDTNRYGVPVHDIAILKVKEPFEFDDTRQPIALYKAKENTVAGVIGTITGWGSTNNGSVSQLQTVSIPIIDTELCDQAYEFFDGLPIGQICAAYYGEGGKDSCQGDSGGPLAIDGRLAGIVSWGNGCGHPYYPGAYTEVAYYREWIDARIEL